MKQIFRTAMAGLLGAVLATVITVSATAPLVVYQGGTGLSSIANGTLIYGSGGQVMSALAGTGTGNALLSGTTPSWGKVGLTTHVSGVLPVANGGTGSGVADYARVYNNADLTATNGIELLLTFNSERQDSNGLHSTSSNTGRLTAQTAGLYAITLNVTFASNTTGFRYAYVRVNGGSLIGWDKINTSGGGGINDALEVSTIYYLNAADYVEGVVYQNSGGNLAVKSLGNHSPEFAMARLAL